MSNICPVCSSQLNGKPESPNGFDGSFFSCPLCGDFSLSRSLLETISNSIAGDDANIAKISHALKTMQKINKTVVLSSFDLEKILERPLPSPKEQADLLVRWIATNVDGIGEPVCVKPNTQRSLIGAKTNDGFTLILDYLLESGLVQEVPGYSDINSSAITLSFEGWEYYEQLIRGCGTYRKAFMAMKFGDDTLDDIFKNVFKPSALEAGFELNKLDDLPKAGLIDDRLRVEIQSSDFVIADLTHENSGAYWEAGYAEGLGKPVIYTCEKEKFENDKTHFDTNHHLTVIWNEKSPQEAGEQLKATIRATLPHLAKQQDK